MRLRDFENGENIEQIRRKLTQYLLNHYQQVFYYCRKPWIKKEICPTFWDLQIDGKNIVSSSKASPLFYVSTGTSANLTFQRLTLFGRRPVAMHMLGMYKVKFSKNFEVWSDVVLTAAGCQTSLTTLRWFLK